MSLSGPVDDAALERAAAAIWRGELVVYPTETVYGLGADARRTDAIGRVFDAKERPADDPIAFAVPTVEEALDFVVTSDLERAFMDEFLPGPVTVVLEKRATVPDRLTGGRSRVGVRVPDHDGARALLDRVSPVTATSANRSGRPAVRTVDDLDSSIEAAAAVVLDGGERPGGASTVVDVESETIHRRGRQAEAVSRWLTERA